MLKAGAVLFNTGCYKQAFSPKSWKNFGADPSYRFRKNAHLNSENDVTEPKARLL